MRLPLQVVQLHDVPHIQRELMLIKVKCSAAQRGELMNLAQVGISVLE
jgi:acetolactate synthase small subunit